MGSTLLLCFLTPGAVKKHIVMATELDLGNRGKDWEKEHIERLTQVLKDTWDKYYPLKTS